MLPVCYHVYMRLKRVGKIIWHTKHELFHIVLGVSWMLVLNVHWQQMTYMWILLAVIGSLIPDIDHLIYFFTYGKKDQYTKDVFSFIRRKQWRGLVMFLEAGHKHNTNLAFHNIYVVMALISSTYIVYTHEYRVGTILLGAMVTHFLFDIAEDVILLGSINKNWMRFGRPKKYLRA